MQNTGIALTADMVGKLNDLIRANIDSSKGFHEAAKVVNDPELKSRFQDFAQNRKILAEQLRHYVEQSQEEPEDSGSALGAAHRLWMDIRARMAGGDPEVVLSEAERGEDYIKHEYEDLLATTGDTPLDSVLHAQYETVRQGHDAIRALRETYKRN